MINENDTTYSECAHGSPKCNRCRNVKVIHWISIKDESPKLENRYLTFSESFGVSTNYWSGSEWDFGSLKSITHWADISHLTPVEFLP